MNPSQMAAKLHDPVRFFSYSSWEAAAKDFGYNVLIDAYHSNTFVALDEECHCCGMFLTEESYFEGFLFSTYTDRQKFEAGVL